MPNYILLYNTGMKNWDVIIIGGGIIGLSLSIELRKKGASVLIVEQGEPGQLGVRRIIKGIEGKRLTYRQPNKRATA